jgi:hypothetical protein
VLVSRRAAPGPVDDILQQDILSLVDGPFCLADVLVAEVPEDVSITSSISNPERSSSAAIPRHLDSTLQLSNTVPDAAPACLLNP